MLVDDVARDDDVLQLVKLGASQRRAQFHGQASPWLGARGRGTDSVGGNNAGEVGLGDVDRVLGPRAAARLADQIVCPVVRKCVAGGDKVAPALP
jgi:hypothetical protein